MVDILAPGHSTRYKAKVDFVSPPSARATFTDHDACFLGVSLENSRFTAAKLEAILDWIGNRFARCTVLVGDSIHRITLESTRGLAPRDAYAQALGLGRQFLADRAPVFEAAAERLSLTFTTCAEVQSWPEYEGYSRRLRALFDGDPAFASSVRRFGHDYHSKNAYGLAAAELARRVDRSCEYFLEEFAVFACLRSRGIPVMVYPGSFSTLAEIADGHYASLDELRDLVVVSLHFKGR